MGTNRPLISVVTTAYNVGHLLPDAIESVLAQHFGDFELILVDDCSLDSTFDVIERYRSLDPRIQVIRNPRNSRAGPICWEPRNDGLRVVRGSFVAYLDSDNTWEPRFLGTLYEALHAQEKPVLVYCNSRNHYPTSQTRERVLSDKRILQRCGPDWAVFVNGALSLDRLGIDQYVDTNEIMHRVCVFQHLGALWPTFHPSRTFISARMFPYSPNRRHNDLELVSRIASFYGIHKISHIDEVLVDYYYPGSRRSRPERMASPGLKAQEPATASCKLTDDEKYHDQSRVAPPIISTKQLRVFQGFVKRLTLRHSRSETLREFQTIGRLPP